MTVSSAAFQVTRTTSLLQHKPHHSLFNRYSDVWSPCLCVRCISLDFENLFSPRPRDRLLAGLCLAQEDAELLHHGHGPLQRILTRLLHQVQPEKNIYMHNQKYLLATTWTRTMRTTWRTLSPGIILKYSNST